MSLGVFPFRSHIDREQKSGRTQIQATSFYLCTKNKRKIIREQRHWFLF